MTLDSENFGNYKTPLHSIGTALSGEVQCVDFQKLHRFDFFFFLLTKKLQSSVVCSESDSKHFINKDCKQAIVSENARGMDDMKCYKVN